MVLNPGSSSVRLAPDCDTKETVKETVRSLRELRPAFSDVAKIVGRNQNGDRAIRRLMSATLYIGLAMVLTEPAIGQAQKVQASNARRSESERTTDRKVKLREAILQAAGKTKLIGSYKFAESIHKEVCKFLGVELDARGYSSRAIQREIREIGAILKECTKS
jgi:hypothetical protein